MITIIIINIYPPLYYGIGENSHHNLNFLRLIKSLLLTTYHCCSFYFHPAFWNQFDIIFLVFLKYAQSRSISVHTQIPLVQISNMEPTNIPILILKTQELSTQLSLINNNSPMSNLNFILSGVLCCFNPFLPKAPFFYPLKTPENQKVF